MTDEVTIPAGMKAWAGGDSAPADWSDGPVMLRNGSILSREPDIADWRDDGLWNDIIAYTPMTPEPAQPAESPEARAWVLVPREPTAAMIRAGDQEQCRCAAEEHQANIDAPFIYRAMLAATTARPTERGAAEAPSKEWCLNMARLEQGYEVGAGMPDHPLRAPERTVLTQPVPERGAVGHGPQDCMWRSGHDGEGPDPSRFFCDVIGPAPSCHRYRAVADTEGEARVLAFQKADPSFIGQPATDQAGEVEAMARAMAHDDWNRRIAVIKASQSTSRPISMDGPFSGLDYRLNAEQWDKTPDDDIVKTEWRLCAKAARAALATQPATGRTMGGEDEQAVADLHALQHDGTPLAAKPTWGGSIIRWAVDEIKGLRTALQNGGE